MAASMDEASPLLEKSGASVKVQAPEKQYQAVASDAEELGAQREWDGHLLKMCGSCDQEGLSTFAYVKLLSPLAYGHNFKRAFGGGFWKHCIIFALLFTTWSYYFIAASSRVGVACGPHPPLDPGHRPDFKDPQAELPAEAKGQQQFLAGATFNPQYANEEQDVYDIEWVDLEGTEEVKDMSIPADEEARNDEQLVTNQIQTAKVQAAEGMAQLGAGRKLLHKHKHDDDEHKKKDGHKHKDEEHKDEDHHDDHHDDKKDKEEHKKGKYAKADKMRREPPRDKMLGGAHHGPESPECEEAQTSLGAVGLLTMITFVVGITYATRMRTALRERFGIKGSKCGDCVAWSFCAPCALCQETRTMAKNNVCNGVWYGQTVFAEAPGQPHEAPAQIEAPTKPV